MFGTVIACDIGSARTRVASEKAVLEHETRAALDPANASRVLAFGDPCRSILGAAEVYPVRGGVADISLAALMLRRFALELLNRRSLMGVSAAVAAPYGLPAADRAALIEVGREAGFRRVMLVNSQLSGAVGAGIDIRSYSAHLVADIGRDTLKTAVIANGGILAGAYERYGSGIFDKHFQAFFAERHRLLITSRTAERIKTELGHPILLLSCRDASTGLPTAREVRSSHIREAAGFCIDRIAGSIARTIDAAPEEAAGDLVDNGVTLIGGGAMQYGLPEALSERLGIPVRAAANADSSVIAGLAQILRGGLEHWEEAI